MSRQDSTSPEDEYFNDLSRQPSIRSNRSDSPRDSSIMLGEGMENGIPRPKRIACVICRKRKLKCDGDKPSCGTCKRLGHKCGYDEVRRKSGPKRGYVKELEARLAQVETQLKSKERTQPQIPNRSPPITTPSASRPGFQLNDLDMGIAMGDPDMINNFLDTSNEQTKPVMPSIMQSAEMNLGYGEPLSWEMIGLGLEEQLPPQDMIDELHQIYFEKIHPSIPMMHKYRYLAAMNLAPHMRPAVCLRYAMWSIACSVTEKYFHYQDVFYHRARKYAESDELKGHGESFITIGHCQCWCLIATYEFKMMYFPRAWMSAGKSTRLAQMMGLHRCDGDALEVKQTLGPPRDWTDREERRRTFWACYCGDRYASIGTGWPMTIEEKDILTKLPSNEDAFEQSRAQATLSLSESMTSEGASSLSPYAAVVVLATLFGRNLTHLHRPEANDGPEDPANGEFWKRHRAMDNILTNIAMFLPEHLRLPEGVRDANIVFVNLNLHTSTICLHQAAILKAERYQLGIEMVKQSTDRCFLAASEIISIMRLITHIDIGSMNPFMSFCLYVAARIYIHSYKKQPEDMLTRSNLEFLLNAMQAQRKKNPLSESFLVQLMVDLDGCGVENPLNNLRFSFGLKKAVSEMYEEGKNTPALLPIHSTAQASYHQLRNSTLKPSHFPCGESPDSGLDMPSNRYRMTSFTVPTREHRSPLQNYGQHNGPPTHLQGAQANRGWNEAFAGGHDGNMNHIQSSNNFDTEMSSDHTSDRHHSISNHPTPPTSHHGSSNTSYSPQNNDDMDPSHQGPANTTSVPPTYFDPSVPFSAFTPSVEGGFPQADGRMIPDPEHYTVHPGWELGQDSGLPTTGLSSLGEGWRHMLDGMGWDGHTVGVDPAWRPQQTSSHRS
ncbi:hypothetical protein MMC32_004356 [Xylographa parallela]|nr:hypothetical protein [Xylographa parallela]